MPRSPKLLSAAALVSMLVLAGCGSTGSSSPAIKGPKVAFSSPAIASGTTLPAVYTCDGKDIAPPLEWGALPAGIGELVLFAVGLTPTPNGTAYHVSVEWAVSGIKPALHRLPAGYLPPHAHLGTTSSGKRRYSICPPKGTSEHYQFELYAIPGTIVISHEFSGNSILETLIDSSAAHGSFSVDYTRK
jgi:phosphatidylethanolamine-binding protein (PEBP) family uncharacterized protein